MVDSMGSGLFKKVTALFTAASCAGCGGSLKGTKEGWLCATCVVGIARSVPPWCLACGLPLLGNLSSGPTRCDRCRTPRSFTEVRAFGLFEGQLRELIRRLKYSGDRRLALPLGHLLHQAAHEHFTLQEYEAIVPVPLHRARLADRGFNQAYLLAKPLAAAARIPIVHALDRIVGRMAQVGLRGDARRANVRDVFAPHPRHKSQIARRNVLLVDDVITTGATADECARILLLAGATRVDVAAVARTP
jgi:ComF family protein